MSVCVKVQLSSWSRSGIKVTGGVVGCGVEVEAHFSVWLKPKAHSRNKDPYYCQYLQFSELKQDNF